MPGKIRCPTCRKETEWENNPYRPFCSDRCQLIDLGAWIEERYRIPQESDELPGEDDDDDEQERR
jgi:endogenous inhibitor of DNA gyrase (YacG/DUF329 family)